jgi:endonuclease/exonuclease/phosphatase family metal-dependent hydrolase
MKRLIVQAVFAMMCLASAAQMRFALWNIGHFANGTDCVSKITAEMASAKIADYNTLLADVDADVFAVCEYNPAFAPGCDAADVVFGTYAYAAVGKKYDYNCNAIFTRSLPLQSVEEVKFAQCVQYRYYTVATLDYEGRKVKVVSTHLDWAQGENGYACRVAQIKQLVADFADEQYVIIAADFNTSKGDGEFSPFYEAGYKAANGGENEVRLTYPAKGPKKQLDNILVKGFDVSNVKVVCEPMLSDHCMIYCDLKLK